MNKLTDKQALQITHEFWQAMADEGCRDKYECSKYYLVEHFISECALCEIAPKTDPCKKCLLFDFWNKNKHTDDFTSPCNNSVFGLFSSSGDKKYAQMIADAALAKYREMGFDNSLTNMIESVTSIRDSEFTLTLLYHCSFCDVPNEPEDTGVNKLTHYYDAIICAIVIQHRCGTCGKINKFVMR